MERPKVKSFDGCEVPELAQKIYEYSSLNAIYDEIEGEGFGWFGLVIYQEIPYIIAILEGTFQYVEYRNQQAARKAWDYLCIRFERWYVKHNE